MGRNSKTKNPKVSATSVIWGCAVGMIALCIPIVEQTDDGVLLPLAVVLGAGAGTMAVWRSPSERQRDEAETIYVLQKRVEALETICSSTELDLTQHLKELGANHASVLQDH